MGKRAGVFFILLAMMAGCMNQEVGIEEVQISPPLHENGQQNGIQEDNEEDMNEAEDTQQIQAATQHLKELSAEVLNKDYEDSSEFSEYVTGVKTRLRTDEKVIALTLDACGGEYGSGFDEKLMEFLIHNEIKANLFINARWIDAQYDTFVDLANNPLFTIENHGTEHRPLSTVPRSAWGITSTSSKEEIVEEIIQNQIKILEITGVVPQYFRSGTAFYDDTSIWIAEDLGVEVVNFDVIGDGGATFTKDQVRESMLQANAGSIVILHMNQPYSETAEGVMEGVTALKELGFTFVHLQDYDLE